MSLSQAHRLRSNRDFGKVYRRGQRASTRHLAMRALKLRGQSSTRGKASRPPQRYERQVPRPRRSGARSLGRLNARDAALSSSASVRSIKTHHPESSAGGLPSALLLMDESTVSSRQPPRTTAPLASRFGISISKKVSKRAVVRNRIKRRLKAVIRRYLPRISPGWWVVIIVRPSAVECDFDDFLRELEYLLKKLEIVT